MDGKQYFYDKLCGDVRKFDTDPNKTTAQHQMNVHHLINW